jgi:hypothetical protein
MLNQNVYPAHGEDVLAALPTTAGELRVESEGEKWKAKNLR